EFANNTIIDYTRPSPSVKSNSNDLQNSSTSASENGESTGSILSKPEIKFVRPADSPTVVKTDKKETVRKTTVKYADIYRKTSKKSNVRGNSQNHIDDKGYWDSGCSRHMTEPKKISDALQDPSWVEAMLMSHLMEDMCLLVKEDARLLAKEQSKPAHLETSTSNAQDAYDANALENSGNSNPTATSINPPTDHMETLAVETPIPTVSSPVSTACLND
nr:hypothetical protein [Tanacetum cinerariifolium]